MEQDPGAFGEEFAAISCSALRIKYLLLPYLYTLSYHSHMNREKREASGSFFWDYGDAVGSFEKEEYVYAGCKFNNRVLKVNVIISGYRGIALLACSTFISLFRFKAKCRIYEWRSRAKPRRSKRTVI
ncbi:putative maltase-glucoamylase 2 [Manis javanica]|nr:putative maltase-glucoamylase 2 [Manis javanica]